MPDIDFTTATAEQIAAVEPGEFIRHRQGDVRQGRQGGHGEPQPRRRSSTRSSGGCPSSSARPGGRTTATTHWSITGRPDGGADEWTVRFADGTCSTLPGHDGDSTLSLAMTPVDFTKVITKSGNPVMMFMTGKIKAKGDLGLAANIANFFDIPKA